jgi:hypothetical protein
LLQKAVAGQMVAGAALRTVREYSCSLHSLVLISPCASRAQNRSAFHWGPGGASGAGLHFQEVANGIKTRASVIISLAQMM